MKTIIVGVDGSAGSARALQWALQRAEATGAQVTAVTSWEYPPLTMLPGPFGYPVPPADTMAAASAEALRSYIDAVGPASVPVEEVVGQGDAATVLLQQATDASADLLVVGTRGRGRLRSVVLGSISRKIASAAPCPVAVVPDSDIDQTKPVVVAVDGSAGSLAALRWAAEVTGGPIRAVHAFEYPFGPEYAISDFSWEDPDELGWKMTEQAVTETLGDRADVTIHVTRGDPRQVLIEQGADASMIVMGARGLTGFEGRLLGSVTTDVASHATVPVVVVPPA